MFQSILFLRLACNIILALHLITSKTYPYSNETVLFCDKQFTFFQITWLNQYNERIRKIVGPELRSQGLMDVYYWMLNKTIHMESPSKSRRPSTSTAQTVTPASGITALIVSVHVAKSLIYR